MRLPVLALAATLAAVGCETEGDPYALWPDPETVFPYVYTPEDELETWEDVRWETETWDPAEDLDVTAQYVLKSLYHRPGAPDEVLDHFDVMRSAIPPASGGARLSFVGDVMWVGDNWSTFAAPVTDLLDGDLRVGNLETPTSADHPTVLEELGSYTFNAPPEMLDGLPLDLLQLNNNHSVDVGDDGLADHLGEGWRR